VPKVKSEGLSNLSGGPDRAFTLVKVRLYFRRSTGTCDSSTQSAALASLPKEGRLIARRTSQRFLIFGLPFSVFEGSEYMGLFPIFPVGLVEPSHFGQPPSLMACRSMVRAGREGRNPAIGAHAQCVP
jgi:hypothetical protein